MSEIFDMSKTHFSLDVTYSFIVYFNAYFKRLLLKTFLCRIFSKEKEIFFSKIVLKYNCIEANYYISKNVSHQSLRFYITEVMTSLKHNEMMKNNSSDYFFPV